MRFFFGDQSFGISRRADLSTYESVTGGTMGSILVRFRHALMFVGSALCDHRGLEADYARGTAAAPFSPVS